MILKEQECQRNQLPLARIIGVVQTEMVMCIVLRFVFQIQIMVTRLSEDQQPKLYF